MRITLALGGNALLRRGQTLSADNQRSNVIVAAERIARIAAANDLVITHGNGPQVGLLALQNNAYTDVPMYPMDVLGAESQAMVGYMVVQELRNKLPDRDFVSLVTTSLVNEDDPAFANPTKFIGPVYTEQEANARAEEFGWTVKPDGEYWRRVVASPDPLKIVEAESIRAVVDAGIIPVCCGGGGVPVIRDSSTGLYTGAQAVIDKDLCAAILARETGAELLVIATDVDGVYTDWGTPQQRRIDHAKPSDLERSQFADGSMGPKVRAACRFVRRTGQRAVIGSLEDIGDIVAGRAGTLIEP